jgi:hypothetical protein
MDQACRSRCCSNGPSMQEQELQQWAKHAAAGAAAMGQAFRSRSRSCSNGPSMQEQELQQGTGPQEGAVCRTRAWCAGMHKSHVKRKDHGSWAMHVFLLQLYNKEAV